MNDMYDECVDRILSQKNKEIDLAKRVLLWILHAKRPLKVKEIQYALAISPESRTFDEESLLPSEILISVCAGIVMIDHESDIIRLAHYTTKEYLEESNKIHFPDAHATIADICIIYLSIVKESPRLTSTLQVYEFLEMHPLYDYAARYWGIHAHGRVEETIRNSILGFLSQEPKIAFVTRVQRLSGSGNLPSVSLYPQLLPPLPLPPLPPQPMPPQPPHSLLPPLVPSPLPIPQIPLPPPLPRIGLLASLDLAESLDLLVDEGEDTTITDSNGFTALHWAAMAGHEASVRVLLKNRGDVKANDRTGLRTLFQAVSKLWTGIKERVYRAIFGGSFENNR